jgi:alkyl hydroperoxide reductase subunit D
MNMQEVKSSLGEFAKDIKLNLGSVLDENGSAGLTENQIHGIALASAYSTRNKTLINAMEAESTHTLTAEEWNAAKIAASLMAMNNIYYRFVHLASDKSYATMPAKLRMNAIGSPGIEKVDFELYSLAVSAINGCGMCIDAHVKEVEKAGISKEGIQSAIRIASVINATAQSLEIS